MIDGHGDDLHLVKDQLKANFSSNVFNGIDNGLLIDELKRSLDLIASYPEPDAASLAKLLATYHELSPAELLVSNGATEAIYLIAQSFRDSYSQVLSPTFSEYADACTIHGHRVEHIHSIEALSPQCQLLWLCNPNNPTGGVIAKEQLTGLVESHPKTLFVVDQSYEYFTHEPLLCSHEALRFPNLILIHSMTKRFAIPGLRLGYITASKTLIDRLGAGRMPWSVNALAIKAGEFVVSQGLPETIDRHWLWQEAKRMASEIGRIAGFEALPTSTHFMLIKMQHAKASELKQYLIDKHGLLIRNASNFVGLDERFFRIATQTELQNELLIEALKAWADSNS